MFIFDLIKFIMHVEGSRFKKLKEDPETNKEAIIYDKYKEETESAYMKYCKMKIAGKILLWEIRKIEKDLKIFKTNDEQEIVFYLNQVYTDTISKHKGILLKLCHLGQIVRNLHTEFTIKYKISSKDQQELIDLIFADCYRALVTYKEECILKINEGRKKYQAVIRRLAREKCTKL